MSPSARDRGLAGGQPLPGWSRGQEEDYEAAVDLLRAVVAAYSARIHVAEAEEAERLRSERSQFVAERRRVSVYDVEEVGRINAEYPQLLRQLRGEAG